MSKLADGPRPLPLAPLRGGGKWNLYGVSYGSRLALTSIAAQSVAYPRLQVAVEGYIDRCFEECEAWDVEAADPSEHRPVQSHVPTLVFSGEFDPVTPPAWGAETAAFLDNAYDFEFLSESHGVLFANDCALALALDFLNAPGSPLDSTCLQELQAPEFVVSE